MSEIQDHLETFGRYLYREREIRALPLNKENQNIIIAAFEKDLEAGILAELNYTLDTNSKVYTIDFRYNDDTTLQTLHPGEWLFMPYIPITNIQDNKDVYIIGNKKVITEEEFDKLYEPREGAYITSDRVGYAVVS